MLAVVRKGPFIKGLEQDFGLFFEKCPVGLVVDSGAGIAEHLHFPGVVTPAHAENDPALGQDVGGGKIFRQPKRVPHGVDVEAAAKLEILGQVGQVNEQQQQIGDALVPFSLEMVFSGPEDVVAQPVHGQGNGLGLVEHRGKMLVGQPPVIYGGAVPSHVVQVHVTGEQATELRYHSYPPKWDRALRRLADLQARFYGSF